MWAWYIGIAAVSFGNGGFFMTSKAEDAIAGGGLFGRSAGLLSDSVVTAAFGLAFLLACTVWLLFKGEWAVSQSNPLLGCKLEGRSAAKVFIISKEAMRSSFGAFDGTGLASCDRFKTDLYLGEEK